MNKQHRLASLSASVALTLFLSLNGSAWAATVNVTGANGTVRETFTPYAKPMERRRVYL